MMAGMINYHAILVTTFATPHYYIAHQDVDERTYLNSDGEFVNALTYGGDGPDTLELDDLESTLTLAAEHDALVLVATGSGLVPV